MSRGPYRRAPRLHVDKTAHRVGDAVHVGSTRWLIRSIAGHDVTLEASNTAAGIIWRTTLDKLPDPIKETNR